MSLAGGLQISVDKLWITGDRYTEFSEDVEGIPEYTSMCFKGDNYKQSAFVKFWFCIGHKFKTEKVCTQFLYRNTIKQQKVSSTTIRLSVANTCNTELGSANSLGHPIFTFWKFSLTRNLLKCQSWRHVWDRDCAEGKLIHSQCASLLSQGEWQIAGISVKLSYFV